MRLIVFLLSFQVILLLACGANGSSSADASGNAVAENADFTIQINGLSTGQAYLIGYFAEKSFRADSAAIGPNGAIQFKRDQPYPGGFYFVFDPTTQSAIQILLDKDQTFTLTTNVNDLVNSTKVDGNLDTELLFQNLQFEADLQPQFQTVSQLLESNPEGTPAHTQAKRTQDSLIAVRKAHLQDFYDNYPNAFFTKFKFAGQNPEIVDVRLPNGELDEQKQVAIYRRQMFDNVDFSDERLLRTPVIFNKLKRTFNELTPQFPDSINAIASFLAEKTLDAPEYFKFFVNWITLNYEPSKTTLMDSEAVYVHMVQNFFTYERVFWSDSAEVYALQLRAHEMAASLIGKDAPNVEAKDPNGQMRSIEAIKDPYIVVYMFNPTCEHCIEETPKLVQFYEEWKPKGVEVFGIAVDTDQEEWTNYVRSTGMKWINVFDPTNRAIYGKYFVNITPEIYVINPERKIIAKNLKVNQIAEVIQKDQNGE